MHYTRILNPPLSQVVKLSMIPGVKARFVIYFKFLSIFASCKKKGGLSHRQFHPAQEEIFIIKSNSTSIENTISSKRNVFNCKDGIVFELYYFHLFSIIADYYCIIFN